MGGFSNPIVGGAENLIRSAIKSPNYVPSTTGWRIAKDGTADLNNTTVRGTLTVTGDNNAFIEIANLNTTVQEILRPPDPASGTLNTVTPAILWAITSGLGLNDTIFSTYLYGAQWKPGVGAADLRSPYIWMKTARYDGGDTPWLKMGFQNSSDPTTVDTIIDSNLTINGSHEGRFMAGNGAIADSAAIGATETVVLTLPSATYKAGRAYKLELSGMVKASAAGNNPVIRFRKTNAAGLLIDTVRVFCNNVNAGYNAHYVADMYVTGSDVTAAMVLTIQGSAGFNAIMNGAAGSPYSLKIYDTGVAANVSGWATQLT